MTNDVLKAYITEGIRALDRMENASQNAKALSKETLMQLLRENENTEYGKKYAFSEIHSYKDFARMVPLSDYSDYEPYIEQMLCFGRKNLLTADEVMYYAHTSGTSGASKMIPCTRKTLDILLHNIRAGIRPL